MDATLDQSGKIAAEAQLLIEQAADLSALAQLRVDLLGKKGKISLLMANIAQLPPPERPQFGAKINELRDGIEQKLEAKRQALEAKELAARLVRERVDVTLPTQTPTLGKIHPISRTMDELIAIFATMGFEVAHGPDIEDDEHNFTALNFAPHHPARDMHDTFYLDARDAHGRNLVLRTHKIGRAHV